MKELRTAAQYFMTCLDENGRDVKLCPSEKLLNSRSAEHSKSTKNVETSEAPRYKGCRLHSASTHQRCLQMSDCMELDELFDSRNAVAKVCKPVCKAVVAA